LITDRLERAFSGRLVRKRLSLEGLDARLSGRNPLAVLGRGYCLIEKGGNIIRSSRDVSAGDSLGIRMVDGRFEATVRSVARDKDL
jgi:exodeoxyribonuclease VII large subunit